MTIDIKFPSEVLDIQDEDEYVNLLIYGDSGVGKTVLAGSDDDVLFIAPEDNGTLSAKRFGSTAKKWKIHGWDDIVAAYNWLYELDPIPFNWIVLDSLTEMQDMCMRKILEEGMEMNPSRDPDTPQLQDWIPYQNRFMRLVKSFNSLPVNTLYTALQMEEETEEGDTIVLPMMQGKGTQYAKKVASTMTSFGRISVQRKRTGKDEDDHPIYEEYRIIQWKASKSVMAKDRTRCLEPKTIIGEGKLGGLKDIRELLEAGPRPAPQPGRVAPKKGRRSRTNGSDGNPMSLVKAGADSDDIADDDESEVDE